MTPDDFDGLSPVCVLAPGVLGSTGIESAEVLRSVIERVRPAQVIAVDALAAASLDRLCSSVQLCDAGIVPGSGVGNNRAALSRETLGVPVLALGVPTVVDAAAFQRRRGREGHVRHAQGYRRGRQEPGQAPGLRHQPGPARRPHHSRRGYAEE